MTVYEKIKGIIYLCCIYRLITGEWPDLTDYDAQKAIVETLTS